MAHKNLMVVIKQLKKYNIALSFITLQLRKEKNMKDDRRLDHTEVESFVVTSLFWLTENCGGPLIDCMGYPYERLRPSGGEPTCSGGLYGA